MMSMKKLISSLRAKLTLAVLVCYFLITIPALLILYYYMNGLVYEQVLRVNHNWVADAAEKVNDSLDSIIDAVSWACLNSSIRTVMRASAPLSSSQTIDVLNAQSDLTVYLTGSKVWNHLNKLVVFNERGVSFTVTRNRNGNLADVDLLKLRHEYDAIDFPTGSYVSLMLSGTLNTPYETAVVAYGRIDDHDAYVYAEINASVFDPLFSDSAVGNLYLVDDDGTMLWPVSGNPESYESESWSRELFDIHIAGVRLAYFENRQPIRLGSIYGLTGFLVLITGSLILVVLVSLITSRYLTSSTRKLVRHISYLSESGRYGLVNPEIEKGNDEMAAIGRTVNRMSTSISQLLERNEKLHEEKRESELSMLQMQVNPHFLYNTLESIHYLAEVQKAEGIARMSRGLSLLLKSIAKGRGRMIRLADELELVRQYDEIQQVRYMGLYEIEYKVEEKHLDCLIQEFTLQPLVENAIFHGIEPSGRDGKIVISAHDDGTYLYVTVSDDGVGMDRYELERIWDEREHLKGNMTGVGIRNIDERIKLYYSADCGLSYESAKGRGTAATVKIVLKREWEEKD